MPDYDKGYKLLFSSPEMVKDLLLGFVREDWVAKLDFDSLEKMNASYVSDDLRARHDDVIWRLRFADRWLYLYILLEFQSRDDDFMAVRVLTYLGLLYQDLIKSNRLTLTEKLPPVLPIVLYNGEPRWQAATEVFDLIENIPGSLARYSPRLKYLLIDEGAYEHAELESLKSLVSLLFQLEKTPSKEASCDLIIRLIRWIGDNQTLQRAFAVYLNRVYFEGKADVVEIIQTAATPDEVGTMLEKNVKRWIEEWKQEGRSEGRAEGLSEGRAEGLSEGKAEGLSEGKAEGLSQERIRLAKKLLATGMSVSKVVELTELTEEQVQDLQDAVAH